MVTLADLLPMLGLRITAGPLELRGIADDDLPSLCELAAQGIHPPDRMPFSTPWTLDTGDELMRKSAKYHWQNRATWSPDAWTLDLGVWREGELVGVQGLSTTDYLVTRTGETGSWLGQRFQGQGIGTAMRRAICALAFDHLDAEEVTSGAFTDNPASLAVSRKVGYRDNGVKRLKRGAGELGLNLQLVLHPEDLVRGEHELVVEGLPAFRKSIGL